MTANDYTFRAAIPVWEKGSAYIQNRTLCFAADVPNGERSVSVAAAASCEFILTVNGVFVAHGPARCAHGYFRVDEYDITKYLTKDNNRVALRVASYNKSSYEYLNQPGFLCAEITVGGEVVAATGAEGFSAYRVTERVERVQKYSAQRTFVETYRLDACSFDYERGADTAAVPIEVEEAKAGRFICRDVPYGDGEIEYPVSVIHRGELVACESTYAADAKAEYDSSDAVSKLTAQKQVSVSEAADDITLAPYTYADVEFSRNTTGIFELDIEADADGELYIMFDEILKDGHVTFSRLIVNNVVTVIAKCGRHHLLCAMPNTMKYARLMARGANVRVTGLRLHHIAFPMSEIGVRFKGDDAVMREIFDAAIETFRANAVDIYMDCPSRERAGWLCDSFFSARVEYTLTGKAALERAFLENYMLPDSFEGLPKGMLPMCYPAAHSSGRFIPNWAMWFGVELREYLTRTGEREFIDACKGKMYALLDYFKPFENEYGLLEKLESWVFVEWSMSNKFVQDVSFVSNMLYARLLSDLGALYADSSLTEKAAKIREAINELSMTESGFYCDNAYRVDGKLVLSGERTESCQYYAFACDVATPESRPWLWSTLINEFGYDRAEKGLYPEIWPANAFIGNFLRLDLLNRYGYSDKLYGDIKGYFSYMAERTGTLWEKIDTSASCNHCFAAHVICWMDDLGLLVRK